MMMIEYWLTKTILMWVMMKIQLMNQVKHIYKTLQAVKDTAQYLLPPKRSRCL